MSSNAIQRAKPAGPVNAAVTTAQIFPDLSSPALAAILNCPGSNRLEQKPFKVTASGVATTAGATTTGTASLYAALVAPGTPLVAADWTLLGAGTAEVINTTSASWLIEADLLFDSLSGILAGTFNSNSNNTPIAAAKITNSVTGINGQTEPVLVFAVGYTFGVNASASNIARLADFCLDA